MYVQLIGPRGTGAGWGGCLENADHAEALSSCKVASRLPLAVIDLFVYTWSLAGNCALYLYSAHHFGSVQLGVCAHVCLAAITWRPKM